MIIWLIRHGLTRLGEEHRYQGSLDDGLSERGKNMLKQAEFQPEHVWVSPAARAMETARILFPEAAQRICEDLREMDFGAFEGRTWQEMETDPEYRTWVNGYCMGHCPGGESRGEFSERVCRAYEKILACERDEKRKQEKTSGPIFIIAHGGTQMALLEKKGIPKRDYYQWQRPCGCGWLLEADEDSGYMTVLREISMIG